MSQALLSPRSAPSHVWHLRRKKVPDELSLPADYVPTDYTSLPPEEPKPSNPLRIILPLLVLLLVLGGVAYAVFFMNEEGSPDDQSTPVPQAQVTFDRSQMIISDDRLITQIDATLQNVADGTEVTASLLENDAPFEFFDPEETVATVSGGKVKFAIPESESHENGRKSGTYKVSLSVAGVEEPFVSDIKITGTALDRFLGEGVAAAEPTTVPTPAVDIVPTEGATEPTAAPEPPTAEPAPGGVPVPLDNIVITRAGIAYGTPYGPALQQGTVNANDVARIVVKLPVGSEVWYLAAIPATGVAGWINSNLIDLPASDVNRITPVSGEAPFAVVRNGGNLRTAPGGDVIRQVEAGLNVRLVERTGDSSWFKIEVNAGEIGWVSGQLLTINPSVLAGVAVAP